jgi:hypothetical protein
MMAKLVPLALMASGLLLSATLSKQRVDMTTQAFTVRNAAICLVAVATFVSLTSCGAAPVERTRLVDTKSSVQLLRNSAADQLPIDTIYSIANVVDRSEECNSGDPWRQWRASITFNLLPSTPARDLYDQTITRYENDGWNSASAGETESTLSKNDSLARIDLVVHEDPLVPTLEIAVLGECVITDGANSDEVRNLEEPN